MREVARSAIEIWHTLAAALRNAMARCPPPPTVEAAANCKAYDPLIDQPERAPDALLADKGYDADAIRAALAERDIKVVIPGRSNRRVKIEHDRVLDKQRNRIERLFGHLKSIAPSQHDTTNSPKPSSAWSTSRQPDTSSNLSTPPNIAIVPSGIADIRQHRQRTTATPARVPRGRPPANLFRNRSDRRCQIHKPIR